jgi:type II secretory pathway component GspD/PulD (secretin)
MQHMTHTRRLWAAAFTLGAAFALFGRHLPAFTLTARDQELGVIFGTIGAAGGFNVIVDPKVRARMNVNLKDVDALQALYMVARMNSLQVKRLEGFTGKTTYAIAPPQIINDNFEIANSRTLTLSFAKADDLAPVIAKALGKDTNLQVEKDSRTNSLVLKGNEEVLGRVEKLVKALDLPVAQVLIDAKVVSVQTTYTRNLGFVWNFGVGKSADGVVTEKTAGSGSLYAITEFTRIQNNGTQYDTPSTAKGANIFSFGDFFRSNLFINSAFAALESSGITRTLSSPRLLAINGATAQLRIGDKIVFTGGPSQPPEERDTGTVLDITPRINRDNFITMDINVDQSTARFDRGDFPTITRTSAKTTVQVRDGEEVLVGGLVQENSSPNTVIVPFLGEIPLIKHFFRRKNNQNTSLELVILMTPKVIKQPAVDTGEVSPPPIVSPGRTEATPSGAAGAARGPAPGAAPSVPPAPAGDRLDDINDIFDTTKPRAPDTAPSASAPKGAAIAPFPPPKDGLDSLGL